MTVFYSHICTRCKTPQLMAEQGNGEHAFLRVSGVLVVVIGWLISVGLFGVLGALVATPVCGWLCYRLIQSQTSANIMRRRVCSACASDSMVPITTPEGERLCNEIGLQPE
jgi:hypothetical protein